MSISFLNTSMIDDKPTLQIDFYDEDLINRLNALLNFSIANSNRNDIINVISRKDFETQLLKESNGR